MNRVLVESVAAHIAAIYEMLGCLYNVQRFRTLTITGLFK